MTILFILLGLWVLAFLVYGIPYIIRMARGDV